MVAVRRALEARRIGGVRMARQLHRIANHQPATLRARDRALDEDEAALDVGADDFQILLGAVARAHVASHLLVFEDAARVLALTGRTMGTVADRHAVAGAHTAETPALHRTGKRSEEHTSELQSLMRISYAGFCLKKKSK